MIWAFLNPVIQAKTVIQKTGSWFIVSGLFIGNNYDLLIAFVFPH